MIAAEKRNRHMVGFRVHGHIIYSKTINVSVSLMSLVLPIFVDANIVQSSKSNANAQYTTARLQWRPCTAGCKRLEESPPLLPSPADPCRKPCECLCVQHRALCSS